MKNEERFHFQNLESTNREISSSCERFIELLCILNSVFDEAEKGSFKSAPSLRHRLLIIEEGARPEGPCRAFQYVRRFFVHEAGFIICLGLQGSIAQIAAERS